MEKMTDKQLDVLSQTVIRTAEDRVELWKIQNHIDTDGGERSEVFVDGKRYEAYGTLHYRQEGSLEISSNSVLVRTDDELFFVSGNSYGQFRNGPEIRYENGKVSLVRENCFNSRSDESFSSRTYHFKDGLLDSIEGGDYESLNDKQFKALPLAQFFCLCKGYLTERDVLAPRVEKKMDEFLLSCGKPDETLSQYSPYKSVLEAPCVDGSSFMGEKVVAFERFEYKPGMGESKYGYAVVTNSMDFGLREMENDRRHLVSEMDTKYKLSLVYNIVDSNQKKLSELKKQKMHGPGPKWH